MSFLTGTSAELLYQSTTPGTAKNTFTSEVTINDTTGMGPQAQISPYFFDPTYSKAGKSIYVIASGILSSTGTPTYTFSLRSGTAANTTAAILLGSAALTTGSGVSNKQWIFEGLITMKTPGAAGANSTVVGIGQLSSPAGLASPFCYELWGGAAQPGTVATFDLSITNFFNFNVACSASSASNSIQLLSLSIWGLN